MPLLCLIAIVGAFAGYPNPWVHFPPLALLFPAALGLMAFRAGSAAQAFRWSLLTGTLAHTACLYWVAGPVAQYGGLPWWLALPCPLAVSLVMGSYSAVFGWALHRAARRLSPSLLCLFAGLLWAALEQTGSWLFSGFPWFTLSVSFAPWPLFIQTASMVGAYGLSGLLVILVTSFLLWNTARSSRVIALGLCLLIVGFGAYRMAGFAPSGPEKQIALVQGNIDQSQKWEAAYQLETVRKYLNLSRKALAEGETRHQRRPATDLLIWPETSMPFYFQDAGVFGTQVREFVETTNVPLILGAPAYRETTDFEFNFFNRAFLLTPGIDAPQWYDKVHLVPFGEYVPLNDWLPLEKLASGAGDFHPGTRLHPLEARGMRLGLLICYEAIFPELTQKRVSNGADVLVNISNDAWFGRSSAPFQHLAQTRMRAVEQCRWIARSTNTGISAFIDPLGRLVASTPLFSDEVLTWTVKPVHVTTFFHDAYRWLYNGIYAMAGLFLAWVILGPAVRRS